MTRPLYCITGVIGSDTSHHFLPLNQLCFYFRKATSTTTNKLNYVLPLLSRTRAVDASLGLNRIP